MYKHVTTRLLCTVISGKTVTLKYELKILCFQFNDARLCRLLGLAKTGNGLGAAVEFVRVPKCTLTCHTLADSVVRAEMSNHT